MVTEEQKKQFASTYLLDAMTNTPIQIPVYLENNDNDLEPILEYMMMKRYIEIHNSSHYIPTQKGKDLLKRFMARYSEFLKIFDIYSAVDLGQGCFAFERYFDFTTDDEWKKYLLDERWEDLRIAVALYKKLNPIEIVFMSFLKEGQFGDRGEGWQFDLLLGSIWDEIIAVCTAALTAHDLEYTDEEGNVIHGSTVLEDIIVQGAQLNCKLHEQEKEMAAAKASADYADADNDNNGEYGVQPVAMETYYSYCRPMYVSPLWTILLFI